MNNKTIRAFEALTVEELELLAVIGSLHGRHSLRYCSSSRISVRDCSREAADTSTVPSVGLE